MKFVKSISLFFVYPICTFCLGLFWGLNYTVTDIPKQEIVYQSGYTQIPKEQVDDKEPQSEETEAVEEGDLVPASFTEATLCINTEFVVEEKNILLDEITEVNQRIPHMYCGMNREQFLEAMEVYEAAPPLSELQKGFESLEIKSFSPERVVIQKNYRLLREEGPFYLKAYDNQIVVYVGSSEIVYFETGIMMDVLPEEVQQEIISVLVIEEEEELYRFLETYSS